MMTDEQAAIAHLDFDPRVPCASKTHAEGLNGCDPDAPARYVVALAHAPLTPTCAVVFRAMCEGNYRHSERLMHALFYVSCAEHGQHRAGLICARCATLLTEPNQLLQLISEL